MATDLTVRRSAATLSGLCIALLGTTAVLYVLPFAMGTPVPDAADSASSGLLFVAAGLVYCGVGTLIARRQPRNTIGWLLLTVSTLFAGLLTVSTWADVAVAAGGPAGPPLTYAYAVMGSLWVPSVGLMATFVVLLFPDGRLPSPRWRPVAWAFAVVLAVLTVLTTVDPDAFADTVLTGVPNPLAVEQLPITADEVFVLLLLCMVVSTVSQVIRYRRADGVERLQLKWLATASVVFVLFFLLAELIATLVPAVAANEVLTEVVEHLLPLAFCAFPVAIGMAVLRYRLYEIDVVISRTLIVGVLATFITGVYVAIVVGVGHLLGRGEEPDLALSIVATAVVAVAFQPVRARVQRWANRLVYGERATPYEVLSQFADRMGGAHDASQLLPAMARTLAQGVAAARIEVWLRRDSGFVRAATWPQDAPGTGPVRSLPEVTADRVVPVRYSGELLGAIAVVERAGEGLSAEEDRLLDDVAAQAGLVLRHVMLIDDLRASRQRLVASQDAERRRLERNLHDGAQQSLVAVALMLRMTQTQISDQAGRSALDSAGAELQLAIADLRELARGIFPAVLAERGLGPALSAMAERSAVPVVVEDAVPGRLPADVERTLYFVASEALAAAAARQAEEVVIRVDQQAGTAVLEIAGTGVTGTDDRLVGLRDRVAVVDGTLSGSGGADTPAALRCTVPLPEAPEPGLVDLTAPAARLAQGVAR